MHEASLVSSIVDQVTAAAKKQNFHQVLKIRLAVGAASGVAPDSLEFCFPELTHGSVLEGAQLILENVPLTISCAKCQQQTLSAQLDELICRHCLSLEVKVTGGKEFLILDLEVL